MKAARPYRQGARARAAEQTRQRIFEAAVSLWRARPWEDVTLADIAAEAGVTVQTVLRKFGSKEGLVEVCLAERASGVEATRDTAGPGDLEGGLEVLFAHYERDGDAVVRTLELEERNETARQIVQHGRKYHRAWCERVFAPYLPRTEPERGRRLDAFVAATDVYVWKLLRRDLGRTRPQAQRVVAELLGALSASPLEEKS